MIIACYFPFYTDSEMNGPRCEILAFEDQYDEYALPDSGRRERERERERWREREKERGRERERERERWNF